MTRLRRGWPALAVALLLAAGEDGETVSLAGAAIKPPSRDRHVDYAVKLDGEQAFVRLPAKVPAGQAMGLVVYVPAGDDAAQPPDGWAAVLDERHLIFAGVGGAGNERTVSRRCGLAVATALRMTAAHKVDPARIFSAGTSGGSRVAGLLGFYQPDLFRGTIQCCGADFYHRVPDTSSPNKFRGDGQQLADATEAGKAKGKVRFALITGPADFNHDFVADVFHGGFEKEHFKATLLDVPGMGHEPASAETLRKALDFVEPPPATKPVSGKR